MKPIAILLAGLAALNVTLLPGAEMNVANAAPQSAADQAVKPTELAQMVYMQTMVDLILHHDSLRAEQGFLRVIIIDPSYSPALFNLGVLAEGQKAWQKAEQYFNGYLAIAPNGPDSERAKAQLTLLTSYRGSEITAAQAKDAAYDGTIRRARVFLAAGFYREAIAEAGRAQSSEPARWESYAVVALSMGKQHRDGDAARFADLAIKHAPPEKRDAVRRALLVKSSGNIADSASQTAGH